MSPEGRNNVVHYSNWVSTHRRRVDTYILYSTDPEDCGCFQAGLHTDTLFHA